MNKKIKQFSIISLFIFSAFLIPKITKANELEIILSTNSVQYMDAWTNCENITQTNPYHLATETELLDFPILDGQSGWFARPEPYSNLECFEKTIDLFIDQQDFMFPENTDRVKQLDLGVCPDMTEPPGYKKSLCARTIEEEENLISFDTISSSTGSAITGSVNNIFSITSNSIPFILSILSIVIGLTLLLKLFRKFTK